MQGSNGSLSFSRPTSSIAGRILLVFAILAQLVQLSHSQGASGSGPKQFPSPDVVLRDERHIEPPSGAQLNGNQITIHQGVGTPTVINALSFSQDGELIAAGKDFGRAVIWNARRREFLRAFNTDQGIMSAVALSGDGRTLATGGDRDDSSVKLWDVATGKLKQRLQLGSGFVASLIFDRSGRWLAIKHNAGKLVIVDTNTGNPVLTIPGGLSARFSPDGAAVITQDKQSIATWDTSSWLRKTTLLSPEGTTRLLLAVDIAADRAAVLEKWSIRLVRLSTGGAMAGDVLPKSKSGVPKGVAFGADGLLIYANIDGRLWVWNTETNELCASPVMYSSGGALSGDGRWLAGSKGDSILSGERTDGVWIWDTARLRVKCGLNSVVKLDLQ